MKLIIITDTYDFKLKLLDDVLNRIAFNPVEQRIDSVTFYGDGGHNVIFMAHMRKHFPHAEFRRHVVHVPVRPGKQPNWRAIIREELAAEPDAGFVLTVVASERFDSVYYNLVHAGVMNNIAMAKSVSPSVTDAINFTRIDGVKDYFGTSYPISSLHIYKD